MTDNHHGQVAWMTKRNYITCYTKKKKTNNEKHVVVVACCWTSTIPMMEPWCNSSSLLLRSLPSEDVAAICCINGIFKNSLPRRFKSFINNQCCRKASSSSYSSRSTMLVVSPSFLAFANNDALRCHNCGHPYSLATDLIM